MIDLLNGQLDRYELKERLGSGGMARVYKAWDTNLERLVAIKILHEHLADDPTFKERFEREAKFIAGFNHPNVVQVYDYDVINRNGVPLCYMVMSYIPGQTLREYLEAAETRSERLPHERVRELVMDMTNALGYAHARGMVHRDVKPGNIILDEHGKAVLTDFGIARMVQSTRLTADGVSTGTPVYMSPEQAVGEPGDGRSDLYSLGIIVYEMLVGRAPFIEDTSLAVMLRHLNEPPPLPSIVLRTRQFDAFIIKALAKKPADRFQTTEEFQKAFEATFNMKDFEKTTILPSQTPIPLVRAGGTTQIFQTISLAARQNPRVSTAIGIAAVAAVLLTILLIMNSRTLRGVPTEEAPAATTAPTAVVNVPTPALATETYFTSSYNDDDPFKAFWSTDGTDFLTRAFTPDGYYQMRNTQAFTAETSIFPSQKPYASISLQMRARLEPSSEPASGYGIVFRYQDENNYNVFAVDGLGRFSVWVRSDGEWTELRKKEEKWTPDPAVNPLGEWNDLTVSILSSFITGYVNEKQVVRVSDGTLPAGRVGMYFATDDGEATVTVDSYQVESSVPSMTTGS